MSQIGAGGPDFELPEELLAVIPTNPYDQLDLARKITSMAIASRVSNLEFDTARLKQKNDEQERHILELQEKASGFQKACCEADSRVKMVNDENVKLAQERDALSATVKKLSRELAKLETFKRQLMQSLSEDSSPSEAIDIRTIDQAVPKSYPQQGGTNGYTKYHSYNGYNGAGASMQSAQRVSMTPSQITPRLTPTATPNIVSARGSPKAYSAVGSPQKMSGTTTPAKSMHKNQISLSSYYPSSQQSSAANSPPRVRAMPGQTPRIDGKEFFRQARSRLSYEQFGAFLTNVKELNAQKQSREETLRKAEEIFGKDNKDLYVLFQGLLSRNVH